MQQSSASIALMLTSSANKFKRGDNNRVVTSNVKKKAGSDVIDLTSDDEENEPFEFISKRKKRSNDELPQITPSTVHWDDAIEMEPEIIPKNSNKIRPSHTSPTKGKKEDKSINLDSKNNNGDVATKPPRTATTSIISKLKQIQTPPKLLNSSTDSSKTAKETPKRPKGLTRQISFVVHAILTLRRTLANASEWLL